ncbi:transmembrane protein 263 isoform X3 [Onychostruthus taczanowskii]|uniref:transmembrane protein 263 isoform X3 n=1 Tax=Onychostruthus taczanowskii TaxID=356909 RepID=UPI001B801065|nr:transmembrane protein 263 isoform X3 [Onychostruthus taczanowskii]
MGSRRRHLPPARAQPGRLCASCRGSAGREGWAEPGVAAPPRPWLPRQCRRPASRCRRCPRRPGRGHGRGSLPGRLRSSAGHAGVCRILSWKQLTRNLHKGIYLVCVVLR